MNIRITSVLMGMLVYSDLFTNSRAMALGFEVEGEIKRTVYKGDSNGTVQSTDKADFLVCLSDREWFLSITQNGGDYRFEFGCDGQDTYYIVYDGEQKLPSQAKELMVPGVVTSGLYPEFADPLAAVVWLSYASGDYFSALRENSFPAPWASPMDDPSSVAYMCKGDFLEDTYRLPKSVIWSVSDENIRKIEAGSPNRNYSAVMLRALKDYRAGGVGGEFRVVSWTNIQGQLLPMEFELTRNFVPGPGVFERYNGVAKLVSARPRQVGVPKIRGLVGVADYRWQDPSVGLIWINYPITNQVWRGRHDTNIEAIFQKRRGGLPLKPQAQAGRKNTIFAALIFLLVIPPVWMLLSRLGFFAKGVRK